MCVWQHMENLNDFSCHLIRNPLSRQQKIKPNITYSTSQTFISKRHARAYIWMQNRETKSDADRSWLATTIVGGLWLSRLPFSPPQPALFCVSKLNNATGWKSLLSHLGSRSKNGHHPSCLSDFFFHLKIGNHPSSYLLRKRTEKL